MLRGLINKGSKGTRCPRGYWLKLRLPNRRDLGCLVNYLEGNPLNFYSNLPPLELQCREHNMFDYQHRYYV